ncbi:MAG: CusA/CzcA family heavy metal efflux RND transporter [Candidatus Eremiobacterota bacterium]
MLDAVVDFSIRNRITILLSTLILIVGGTWCALTLPIDAVPDITTPQVVVNMVAPALAPEDIERRVTRPVEIALSGLPGVTEVRSVSQFGLSQVTLLCEEAADLYRVRLMVNERLSEIRDALPPDAQPPALAPMSTGLGEIYYVFVEGDLSLMERRSILDWQVRPRLRTVPGIIEVNSYGGHVKQYQVLADPDRMRAHGVSLARLREALVENNRNAGGAWIPKQDEQQLVQGIGVVTSLEDIRNIVLGARDGVPILVGDVASVELGPAIRQGTMTRNGRGEAVAAIAVMLIGENSRTVTRRVKERVAEIQREMPPGVTLVGFLDRTRLVDDTLHTAGSNLLHGGILVVGVLFLFLLQLKAGLIVSSAIPLAMLFAIVGMRWFGVSASLMSLGAIDFGLIVDAAVIIVENCVRRLAEDRQRLHREPTEPERLSAIRAATVEVRQASQFGELILIAAYLPVLSLAGIEGKMFRPMALTVVLALAGALLLSATVIPALCACFLKAGPDRENPGVAWLQRHYLPLLRRAVHHRVRLVASAALLCLASAALFPLLGSEFLPKLDEGTITINPGYLPGISVDTAIRRATTVERYLLRTFPDEIESAATRIGRPDIATDPMLLSQHDIYLPLKPRSQWKQARTKAELIEKIERALQNLPGMKVGFTQPIEMRMNEMSEGVGIRSEIGVKLFGPDLEVLQEKAAEIADLMREVRGGADVSVEATAGLPVLEVRIRRGDIARYGINVADVQEVVETAIGGSRVGQVVEGERVFDLVLRYAEPFRQDPETIGALLVNGVPLAELADLDSVEAPVQLSRESAQRRVVIQANVRGRDLGGYVEEVKRRVAAGVRLPAGYHLEWGGQYEHLLSGRARLAVVVPITFAIIFALLVVTYGRVLDALRVFTGIPFAVSGGILALFLRGMPFSMSAGVGFIALSGISVLADMVMVQSIRQNLSRGLPLVAALEDAAVTRLRPVLMTASVAAIGFLPMALSTGTGAEVQKPLATVVIGGLLTSTALTLFVLPALYSMIPGRARNQHQGGPLKIGTTLLAALAALSLAGCGPSNQAGSPTPSTAATPPTVAYPQGSIKKGDKAFCVVCVVKDGEGKEEAAAETLDYEGKTYAFCNESEKAEFISNPSRYAVK